MEQQQQPTPPIDIPEPQSEQQPDPVMEEVASMRADLEQRLNRIRKVNVEKVRALYSDGEVPNPSIVLQTRLQVLLDMLLDETGRLAFDVEFEDRMTTILNEALAESRQRRIAAAAGAKTSSGLFLPK